MCLVPVPLCLFVCLCLCFSVCLSVSVCLPLCFCLSVPLCVSVWVLSVCLSVCLSLSLSLSLELSRHMDVSVHTGPQPTLPSTHSKPASSCTPIAPVTGGGGGGCSGDTCVTQACSVCPAVCFNGSLFLYTPDWCVLVA